MTSATTELPHTDVIVDKIPYSGVFNMSMDAALLQLAAERERSVVRIYQWSEPTMTQGYFQGSGQATESPFPSLPVVRRLSGGGAILHDREMTYSLVLPASHPARQEPSGVYEIVHRAIIELLCAMGVPCQLRSELDAMTSNTVVTKTCVAVEPFLCFLRKNPNDVIHISGSKIVGSAQRRRRGITLQHGSIILKASPMAPQVLGILDLEPSFAAADFRRNLPHTIAGAVSRSTHFRSYTETEELLAAAIALEMG